MKPTTILFLVLAAIAATSDPATAQYICASTASFGELDPDGSLFTNRFRRQTAVNTAGDMLLIARPAGERDHLYVYPDGGVPSVVAEGSTASPVPGATFTSRPFDFPSINASDDIAFWGRLKSQGEGVFARMGGGALSTVAVTTGVSPAGGTFDDFPRVGEVNDDRVVAFLANVTGGPSGVFSYDVAAAGPVIPAVLEGDVTTGGREICEILEADQANGLNLALLAVTKVSCANAAEPPVDSVILAAFPGPLIIEVANVGDASPIAGTTYASFDLVPQVNAASQVAFAAAVTGAVNVDAVFLWDGVASTVVTKGDFSPEAGSSYLRFSQIGLAGGPPMVFVKARMKGPGAKEIIVRFDPPATTEKVISKDDAPPDPPYAAGSFYKKLGKLFSVAPDASHVGLVPKVKDAVAPRNKVGVVRCDD